MGTPESGFSAPPHYAGGTAPGDERAALGVDGHHRIVLWNRAAERLLGHSATDVIGRRCYEVLDGRDSFGNRFCHGNCAPHVMIQRGESVNGFELGVAGFDGREQSLRVSSLPHAPKNGGSNPSGRPGILHVLEPAEEVTVVNGRAHLTPREREVLALMASGLQNKEVATRLGLSLATVRNHVHNILEGLAVHSKLEAVALAYRNGWVEPLNSADPGLPVAGTP